VRPRWRRRLLLLVAAALAFVWLPRLLTVSEAPGRADLLFVLPGEVPGRARCAARLYRDGVAPVVVFSGGRMAPELEVVGRPLTDAEVNAAIATREGVPDQALRVLPAGTSTWEDAGVLRAWLLAHPARDVLAVTSPIHSRRALATLRLAVDGTATRVRVTSCDPPSSPASLWWLEERPLIQVVNETAKLVLYTFRYFLPAAIGLGSPPAPRSPGEERRPPQPS
jgi:uncharacterized SAM-binding protein YcdF (DUF218 family)